MANGTAVQQRAGRVGGHRTIRDLFATQRERRKTTLQRWNRPKTKPGTETETLSAAARIRAAKRVDGRSSRVATYAHCSALLCEVHARQSPVHVAAAMVHRRASSVALIVHCSRRRWTSCDPSLQPGCNQCMCLVHVVCCVPPVCGLCLRCAHEAVGSLLVHR